MNEVEPITECQVLEAAEKVSQRIRAFRLSDVYMELGFNPRSTVEWWGRTKVISPMKVSKILLKHGYIVSRLSASGTSRYEKKEV